MFNVIFEPQFLTDYRNIKKNHPEISKELATALTELKIKTIVIIYESYLANGKFDVLVIYLPHKSKLIIPLKIHRKFV